MKKYPDNIIVSSDGSLAIKKYTKSYANYGDESLRTLFFLYSTMFSDEASDDNTREALMKRLAAVVDKNDIVGNKLHKLFSHTESSTFLSPDFYGVILNQMVVCKLVDSFLVYLKDILSETVSARPEILKSKDTERLDFILKFDNIEELRSAIAERKVEELSYKGFKDIVQYFEDRLGLKPLIDENFEELHRKIKERNLLVHNRGIITQSFIDEFKLDAKLLGLQLQFSFVNLYNILTLFYNTVVVIDSKISEKFNLETYSDNSL